MKENKIPTAKELLNDNFLLIQNGMTCEAHTHLVVKQMVEFAKLHVEAALKVAADNAKWEEKSYETRFGDDADSKYDFVDTDYAGDPCTGYIISVNKDSILNSYPDELIK